MGKLEFIRRLGGQRPQTSAATNARIPTSANPDHRARTPASHSFTAPASRAASPVRGTTAVAPRAIEPGTQLRFIPEAAWSTFIQADGKQNVQEESPQARKTFDLRIEQALPSKDARIQQYTATYVADPHSSHPQSESVVVTGTHHQRETYFSLHLASGGFVNFQVPDGQSGRGQFQFRKDTEFSENGRPVQHIHGFSGSFETAAHF